MNKHCFLNHERTSQRFQGEGCFERLQHMVHIAIAIEKKKMLGIRLGLSMANNTLEKTNTDSIGNQRLSFVIFLLLSEGNEGAKIRTELMTFFKKRCNDTISPLIFFERVSHVDYNSPSPKNDLCHNINKIIEHLPGKPWNRK